MVRGAESEFKGTARFAVRRRLGAGAMGVVYEALDREIGTRVAIKTLRYLDGAALVRFKNEFRALQGLEHPNLVTLGELLEETGDYFFTMELVDGVDFLRYVRPDEPSDVTEDEDTLATESVLDIAKGTGRVGVSSDFTFDEEKLRASLAQLARGLSALHEAGKVHRDVKPSNVRVTRNGRVVLLDFGLIAELADDRREEGLVVGTAGYMAPEQASHAPISPAADWYAFGVVMYEALTGQLPFTGRTALEILIKKKREAPAAPRSVAAGVPEDLDTLCMALLRTDPQMRPNAGAVLDVLGVELRARTPTAPPIKLEAEPSRFVGRERELAVLHRAIDDVREGGAVTVVVHGDSGLGKSALIRQFLATVVSKTDPVLLEGRCYERESVPYKGFDGVIDSLSHYMRRLPREAAAELVPRNAAILPRVFPVLSSIEVISRAPMLRRDVKDPLELRDRAFVALRELLHRIAERRNLVVFIDDLQWADADSLLLLREVMRPPDAPPLLLLIASRPDAKDHAGALPGDVRPMELLALSPESARALARSYLADAGIQDVSAANLAIEAKGHPMYIDELARHVAAVGSLDKHRPRLNQAIWARASQLEEPAVRILQLVALAGAPMPQETIRAAAQLDAPRFAKYSSVLRSANLIRSTGLRGGDHIEPFHDRVRESTTEQLDAEARIERHQRLAAALEGSGLGMARPELLVRHLERSGQHRSAARYALEAARRASEAFAFDRTAELYQSVLRLADPEDDPNATRAARIALGEALANAGRGTEAADAFLEAAEGADLATRRDCQRQAAQQLLISGRIDLGMKTVGELLADAGASLPVTPRGALLSLAWQRIRLALRGTKWTPTHESEIAPAALARLDAYQVVAAGLSMVDNIRGADFQSRCLLLALKLGEQKRVAYALGVEAMFTASQGGRHLAKGSKLCDEASSIADASGDPFLLAGALGAQGVVTFFHGQWRRASERLLHAIHSLREQRGTTWEVNNAQLFRLFTLRYLGKMHEMQELADEYLRDAQRRGDRYAETSIRRMCDARWLAQDLVDEALRDIEQSTWEPPDSGYHLQHFYELQARVEIALYTREVPEVIDELRLGFQLARRSLLLRAQLIRCLANWLWGRVNLALAEADVDRERSLRSAKQAARKLLREQIGYATVWGTLVHAGVAAQEGSDAAAHDHLREAMAVATTHDMALCVAVAKRRDGELMGGHEGDALMAEADAWMTGEAIAHPERWVDVTAPGFTAPRRSPAALPPPSRE